jgi:hypothetical protein
MDEDKRASDPTSLTTQQIIREITNLKENTQQRFDAMDKAVYKLAEDNSRVPTILDKTIGQLKELIFEKFNGVEIKFDNVEKQFAEREVRTDKLQIESQRAITAAFSAQNESASSENQSLVKAINKAEQITENQLVQQKSTLSAVEKTLADKISGLTDRFNTFEGKGSGKSEISGVLWALVGTVFSAIAISAIMAFINKQPDDTKTVSRLDAIENAIIRHESEGKQLAP